MLNIVILDKDTLGEDIDLSSIYALGDITTYPNTPQHLIKERIADADVVITNKIKLGADNLCDVSRLKLICVAATGYDNISTQYCLERGIALCNVPGYSTPSVAQITAAMVLSLASHLPVYRDFVHSGRYSGSGVANRLVPVYHELSSMTWGVIGGGNIGSQVAQIASAFGCDVLVCRRKNQGEFPLVDIDTICKTCDIITLHLPLDDSTREIINNERIKNMKKGVIFVNTARGALTDEAALAESVKSGHMGGLGIDVYSKEPFGSDHPFCSILDRDNVCLTPHMAWGSEEARARCVEEIASNITSFFDGTPKNRIV